MAILAALSAKIGWVVLFTAGAALCFALAAWAFQTREVKLSQDLRLVNGRFLQSVQTGEANVAKEREHCEHLQKNVAELEEISQEQACEIMTLRQVAEQQELELAQFSLKVKALQAQNQRLLDIEERIRSWV